MSYDLRIYTIKKQDYNNLKDAFKIDLTEDGFVYQLKNHIINVSNETPIDDEDIPQQISKSLPGLQYLIECSLEPITDKKKYVDELLKISKAIAKNGIGVIENPQTDEIILPSGIKRVLKAEKDERFSIMELSWWFNDRSVLQNDNLKKLLYTLEKHMPEALPRRYGEYEPPKEKFTDIDTFYNYLVNVAKNYKLVWYPNKPIDYVHLGVPDFRHMLWCGCYIFCQFSISIDSIVLTMPGWKTAIVRLFRDISSILNPFYGDIYMLKNNIRSRTTSYSDEKTEEHPIRSWFWDGIPKEFGIGMVIGNPLHDFVKIKNPNYELGNGCKIIVKDTFDKLSVNEIEVDENIYQVKKYTLASGGDKTIYPKIWPFDKEPKNV